MYQIPDDSITSLYPLDDNFVPQANGKRSPKSLADLATDALCRSMPRLQGELPPGLPQEVVDGLVQSLLNHSALNATTLRIFRQCELGALSLSRCRGVSDVWLEALVTNADSPKSVKLLIPHVSDIDTMDLDDNLDSKLLPVSSSVEESSACSSNSFVSATSNQYTVAPEEHPMLLEDDDDVQEAKCGSFLEYLASDDPDLVASPTPCWYDDVVAPPLATSNLTLLDLRGSLHLTDRGLLQLHHLTQLQVAKLDDCHSLVGHGLLALSDSHQLHTLSLANCRRLTDAAVLSIAHLKQLRTLVLDGCRCLTDRSLEAVAELTALRQLGLGQCDLLTDGGLEHLQTLLELEELSLGWCRQITNQGIDTLSLQPGRASKLRTLRLSRLAVTDGGVAHLARLGSLEELDLSGCSRVRSTALGKTLQQLPKLTSLDVSYCPDIL